MQKLLAFLLLCSSVAYGDGPFIWQGTKARNLTTGGINNANGSVSLPSYSFTADTDTGMYSGGTDILSFSTNGTAAVTIDATQQVGIGTTSPSALLSVGSGSKFQVDTNGNPVKVNNLTTSYPSSQGVNHSTLHNNASGTLSWVLADLTTDVTGALPLVNGGTGTAAASANAAFNALSPLTTKGDIVGFSTVNARVPAGADGTVLSADSTQTAGLKYITVMTNPMTTPGDTIYGGTAGAATRLAAGTTTQLLHSGTTPSWSAVSLSNDVSGTLPIGSGGTGASTAGNAFNALSPMTTSGDIIYGSGSGAGTRLGIGSPGNVLTVSGGNIPSWAAPATAGTVTSVAQTVPAFLSIAGSPITSSGTLAITLSGTALPIANGGTAVTSVTTAPAATAFAGWDANKNLTANNHIQSYTTTATAAGTTTLVVGSTEQQFFTGTTTQTVVLPVTSTLVLGQSYFIVNNSTGLVTVQSSGGNAIQIMSAHTEETFTVILTSGTTAASWAVTPVAGQLQGTGSNDAAAAGNIGEYISSSVDTTSVTTAIFNDITSIDVTPGNWSLSFNISHGVNTAVAFTGFRAFMGTTAGNNVTGFAAGDNGANIGTPVANSDMAASVADFRVSVSATTTYYMKVKGAWSSGAPEWQARISATRVR